MTGLWWLLWHTKINLGITFSNHKIIFRGQCYWSRGSTKSVISIHHPVRQFGAYLPLLRGGVLLQVVGHGDVQQGIVLCLLPPSVAGAEFGEGDDLAAEEDFDAVVELAESAGGEPEEFRKDCGADDRSLFGFYQGRGGAGALRTGTGTASNHRAADALL